MSYRLPECLRTEDDTRALEHLKTYYGRGDSGPYTGSYFNSWAGEQDPYRFTADDLIAVSFLTVHVPAMAARAVLETRADECNGLLRAIGPDRDLVDEDAPGSREHAAWRLEAELRKLDDVGRTTASKLCARKRPRLFPIYDSVVGTVTGVGLRDPQWEPLRTALRADDCRLHRRLESLRARAGIDEVSVLRVYDVICWMEGKERGYLPPEPDDLDDPDADAPMI